MNNINEEIMSAIDNIETVTMESEMNVVLTLSELYSKQMMIMEYASSEEAAEEIIQEGFSDAMKNFGKDVIGSGNQESIAKKILLIIPRFFKAIFTRIKSLFSKIKRSSKKDKKVQEAVQQGIKVTDLKDIVHDGEQLSEAAAKQVVDHIASEAPKLKSIIIGIGKDGKTKAIDVYEGDDEEELMRKNFKPSKSVDEVANEIIDKALSGVIKDEKDDWKIKAAQTLRQASEYIDLRTGKIKYYDLDMFHEFAKQVVDFFDECAVFNDMGDKVSRKDVNTIVKQLLNHEIFTSPRFGSDRSGYNDKNSPESKVHAIKKYGYKFYDPDEFQEKVDKILKLIGRCRIDATEKAISRYIMAYDNKSGDDWKRASKNLQKLNNKIFKVIHLCNFQEMNEYYDKAMKQYTQVMGVFLDASQRGVSRENLYNQAIQNKKSGMPRYD